MLDALWTTMHLWLLWYCGMELIYVFISVSLTIVLVVRPAQPHTHGHTTWSKHESMRGETLFILI